jgi:hypothetical protein
MRQIGSRIALYRNTTNKEDSTDFPGSTGNSAEVHNSLPLSTYFNDCSLAASASAKQETTFRTKNRFELNLNLLLCCVAIENVFRCSGEDFTQGKQAVDPNFLEFS